MLPLRRRDATTERSPRPVTKVQDYGFLGKKLAELRRLSACLRIGLLLSRSVGFEDGDVC